MADDSAGQCWTIFSLVPYQRRPIWYTTLPGPFQTLSGGCFSLGAYSGIHLKKSIPVAPLGRIPRVCRKGFPHQRFNLFSMNSTTSAPKKNRISDISIWGSPSLHQFVNLRFRLPVSGTSNPSQSQRRISWSRSLMFRFASFINFSLDKFSYSLGLSWQV